MHIYECALSDTAGKTTFQHVVSNSAYSGIRRRRYDRENEEVSQITVRTAMLDDLIPENVPINLIKVDVEGAELQVFKGALKLIKKNKPIIIFEHGLGAADYYGTKPEDVYDLLAGDCGLQVYLMADYLAGDGLTSLSRIAFCNQFYSGKNYYFMAKQQ